MDISQALTTAEGDSMVMGLLRELPGLTERTITIGGATYTAPDGTEEVLPAGELTLHQLGQEVAKLSGPTQYRIWADMINTLNAEESWADFARVKMANNMKYLMDEGLVENAVNPDTLFPNLKAVRRRYNDSTTRTEAGKRAISMAWGTETLEHPIIMGIVFVNRLEAFAKLARRGVSNDFNIILINVTINMIKRLGKGKPGNDLATIQPSDIRPLLAENVEPVLADNYEPSHIDTLDRLKLVMLSNHAIVTRQAAAKMGLPLYNRGVQQRQLEPPSVAGTDAEMQSAIQSHDASTSTTLTTKVSKADPIQALIEAVANTQLAHTRLEEEREVTGVTGARPPQKTPQQLAKLAKRRAKLQKKKAEKCSCKTAAIGKTIEKYVNFIMKPVAEGIDDDDKKHQSYKLMAYLEKSHGAKRPCEKHVCLAMSAVRSLFDTEGVGSADEMEIEEDVVMESRPTSHVSNQGSGSSQGDDNNQGDEESLTSKSTTDSDSNLDDDDDDGEDGE